MANHPLINQGHRARFVHSPAFTLLEVLIYLAIVVILLVAAVYLINSVLISQNRALAHKAVESNLRFALNRLGHELRLSRGVSGQSIFNRHPGKLVLRREGLFNQTVFEIAGNALTIKQSGTGRDLSGPLTTTDVVISQFLLEDLRLKNQDAVRITLQVDYRDPKPGIGLQASASSVFTVTPRNQREDEEGELGFEYVPPTPDSDVVLMYHFAETEGPVIDSSDYGNHGTARGAGRGVSGKLATAAQFGPGQDIEVGTNDSLTKLDSFTLEAWIKPDTLKPTSQVILAKGDNCHFCGGYGLGTRYSSFGLTYSNAETGWEERTWVDGLATGVWQHVAASYDAATKEVKLYLNGELLRTVSVLHKPNQRADSKLYIGSFAGRWDHFRGQIDAVRISKIARTDFLIPHADGRLNITNTSLNAGENLNLTVNDEDLDKLPGRGRRLKRTDKCATDPEERHPNCRREREHGIIPSDDVALVRITTSRGDEEEIELPENEPGQFAGHLGTIFSGEPKAGNGIVEIIVGDTITATYLDAWDPLYRQNQLRQDQVTVVGNVSTLQPSCPADQDTAALYHLDDELGEVIDATGYGHNGAAFSVKRGWRDGERRFAEFAGLNHILLPYIPYVSQPRSFTIEAWIKPTTTSSGHQTIISDTGLVARDGVFHLNLRFGTLSFSLMDPVSGYSKAVTAEGIKTGIWQHVAASYDAATKTVKLYINGRLKRSEVLGFELHKRFNPIYVGSQLNRWNYFRGGLDELRISRRAREDFCLLPTTATLEIEPTAELKPGEPLKITLRDRDQDLSPGGKNDQVAVMVTSSGGDGERLTLLETAEPGTFSGKIATTYQADQKLQDGILQVTGEMTVTVSFADPHDYHNQPTQIQQNLTVSATVPVSKLCTVDEQTVALWSFDEGQGQTAVDSVGQRLAFLGLDQETAKDDPAWQTGISGTSLSFDGQDDWLRIISDTALELKEGTIEWWWRPDDLTRSQYFFSKDYCGGNGNGELLIGWIAGLERIYVRLQQAKHSYFIASNPGLFQVGQWYHLAFSFGPEGLKMYVNGEKQRNRFPWYQGGLVGNQHDLILGASNAHWFCYTDPQKQAAAPKTFFFRGMIDELKISKRQQETFCYVPQ